MSGIPPNQCYICYQTYNNDRVPLILTTCGHTYCKECLLLILNRENKEIVCPECKQITILFDNEIGNLPKNRSLLNLIIYSEQINYNQKLKKEIEKTNEQDKSIDKDSQKQKYLEQSFFKYDEILNKLEETYKSILNEHSYLNEISEVLIIKEIDDVLDNFIDVINEHRQNLQKKIKTEFEKVNLIKNFCNSISCLRNRLNNYIKFYKNGKIKKIERKINENSIENIQEPINLHLSNNFGCFNQINMKNSDNINNIDLCEINLLPTNKVESSIEIHVNVDNNYNFIQKDQNENSIEHEAKIQDEYNNQLNYNNSENPINIIKTKSIILKKEECIDFNNDFITSNLKKEHEAQNKNGISYVPLQELINLEDLENLENEIKYSELYYLTLKHFTKEIYNPCKFFYINKFQIEKLCNDLKKLLFKACDYDENIVKYKIQELNNYDEKKFIKELQECCQQSNNSKLKFLFSHFRINPNFIFSEVLDQITNQQGPSEHPSANPLGLQMNNINNSNTINNHNMNNLSLNQFPNHNTFSSLNIFDPIGVRRNTNNQNRNLTTRYNSNILNNSNAKDKVFNFFTYLKSFKDKTELNDLVRFLIEEFDYVPLKIEHEGNFDLKLIREFDWKMELSII